MSIDGGTGQSGRAKFSFAQRLGRLWGRLPTSQRRRHSLVGPANLWQMKRDFQYNFLLQQGLKPADNLCDFGCGTLRGGLPLIAYLDEGRYTGIDARVEAIEAGLGELREARLENKAPTLVVSSDITSISFSRQFDYMLAFSVFMHLEDQILDAVLGFAARQARVTYANVSVGSTPAAQWLGFPVLHRSITDYEQICAAHGLKIENIGPLSQLGHVTGDDSQDQQYMLRITSSDRNNEP